MVKFNFIVLKKGCSVCHKVLFLCFLSFSSVFGFSSTFLKLNIDKGNVRVLLRLMNSLVLFSKSNRSSLSYAWYNFK